MPNFRTEAPYVVTRKAGDLVLSSHYEGKEALRAARDSGKFRVVYGRHRGIWTALVHYDKGVKLWSKT